MLGFPALQFLEPALGHVPTDRVVEQLPELVGIERVQLARLVVVGLDPFP
jgi:hypothetical protein